LGLEGIKAESTMYVIPKGEGALCNWFYGDISGDATCNGRSKLWWDSYHTLVIFDDPTETQFKPMYLTQTPIGMEVNSNKYNKQNLGMSQIYQILVFLNLSLSWVS